MGTSGTESFFIPCTRCHSATAIAGPCRRQRFVRFDPPSICDCSLCHPRPVRRKQARFQISADALHPERLECSSSLSGACHKLPSMALSSLLNYLGVALLCCAGAFFLIGVARTARRAPFSGRGGGHDDELLRARLIQLADWKCSAGLLATALAAFVTSLIGPGPFFTRPSGNAAGAVLLIAAALAFILIVALLVRHVSLSRALRDQKSKVGL